MTISFPLEPKYAFKRTYYKVSESSGELVLAVIRTGDTTTEAILEWVTENGNRYILYL